MATFDSIDRPITCDLKQMRTSGSDAGLTLVRYGGQVFSTSTPSPHFKFSRVAMAKGLESFRAHQTQ